MNELIGTFTKEIEGKMQDTETSEQALRTAATCDSVCEQKRLHVSLFIDLYTYGYAQAGKAGMYRTGHKYNQEEVRNQSFFLSEFKLPACSQTSDILVDSAQHSLLLPAKALLDFARHDRQDTAEVS